MKHLNILCLTGFLESFMALAQQTIVRGSVNNLTSNQPLHGVHVEFEQSLLSTDTDTEGVFEFSSNIPIGEHILKLTKPGYLLARYPIVVYEGQTLDIQDMVMSVDLSNDDLFTITLTDDELNDDSSGVDNISGLLGSSKDIFQRTAAFEFSTSFFNVRGLNSENGTLLMNGIEMNKLSNGRPQWSNWGGLNDVLRNQELTSGLAASSYNFGGVLGSTNINLRASEYQSSRRITYSSSNRSYTNRLLATYASGIVKGGWSYVFSLGRRWGNEGYQDGTFYDANSFFGAVEKRINKNHSLNFTAFYTPNRRGKSSPNSQEVYDLKNIKYNEYWGYQDGRKRNSRVKRISEPVAMLNYYWNISDRTKLNTNIAYQFGELGNSRLDYAGGANPSPAYYQDLPSYFLANSGGPDLAGAYEAYQNFTSDGQLDWNQIYDANITNNTNGNPAAYVLYEDRNDDTQLTFNTILSSELSDHMVLNAAANYKRLQSHNFAEILDMLGSTTGYLNIDSFDQIQLNLKNPNQIVGQGDIFKYNYNLEANVLSGFAQAQFTYNKVDFFIAASITKTDYQREGFYQHEIYVDNSYGKGPKVNFTGIGTKGGPEAPTSGIKLILNLSDSYNRFNKGREVYIRLNPPTPTNFPNGLYIGEERLGNMVITIGGGTETNQYGTTVTSLSENQINASVFRSSDTYDLIPLAVQISQLSKDHIGIFVQIENAEFEENLNGERYFNPSENYDTSRTIQTCSGTTYSTFDLETSSFSSFKNELLPTGNGTVAGIISKTYDGSRLVLALNTTDDVNMNAMRCSL